MVSQRIGAFVQRITDKLLETTEGDKLFCEIDGSFPDLTITNDRSVIQSMAAPLAFEFPNNIEVAGGALPTKDSAGFDFDENDVVEAKFTLGFAHELLHRIQSTKEGLREFFEARFQPQHLMHAELLVEAENYARTAQVGWRLSHDDTNPNKIIADYMLSSDPKNHNESAYAVYVAHMKNKPLTEENELESMKLVVEDFLFSSANAQRYLSRRVTETYDYLNSGRLKEALTQHNSTDLARAWMYTQPQISGMGPDAAEYNPDSILELGVHGSGNIFDIEDGFMEKLTNPDIVYAFLTDEEKQKLNSIIEYTSQLSATLNSNGNNSNTEHGL